MASLQKLINSFETNILEQFGAKRSHCNCETATITTTTKTPSGLCFSTQTGELKKFTFLIVFQKQFRWMLEADSGLNSGAHLLCPAEVGLEGQG